MNHTYSTLAGLSLLVLTACSSSDDPDEGRPKVAVTELAAGTYAVASGDAANPTAGKYYAAADGTRLLVLDDDEQRAAAIYHRPANGAWRMTSVSKDNADVSLELLSTNPIPAEAVRLAAIARSYTARLATGAVAAFAVTAAGDIVAGNSACQLSGKIGASPMQDALPVSLVTQGCGLPARSEGYLVADTDHAPASFRLLTYTDDAVADIRAYPE